jgi:hypothetical protein
MTDRLRCDFCGIIDSPATPVVIDAAVGFVCCKAAKECAARQRRQQ